MNNFKKYEEDIFTSLEYNDGIYEKRWNKYTQEVEEINPDGELTLNEGNEEYFKPTARKDKSNPNFLYVDNSITIL